MQQKHAPRLVIFRANAIDTDSRAKKIALTADRLGYEATALSAHFEADFNELPAQRSIGPVRVLSVLLQKGSQNDRRGNRIVRRRRLWHFIDWMPADEHATRKQEYRAMAHHGSNLGIKLWGHFRLRARIYRFRAQRLFLKTYRVAWREWDKRWQNYSWFATTGGTMPEIEDYARSFGPVIDEVEPDIIHVHHPVVLGTAVRAARRRRAQGHRCFVVYDAREDFCGLPKQEQGRWRRYSVLLREERRYIRHADAVMTVSEPIAGTLQRRYQLKARPAVVLNVPVLGQQVPLEPDGSLPKTVREEIGLPEGVPLVVYSGAVSRARGVDVVVEALPHMPGVHAVVVPTPYPHPLVDDMLEQVEELGVSDRFHVAPPVAQDHLLHYLSGADIGLMPFRTGSANIEQAMPNKLFEYTHAGLAIVTSNSRLLSGFITDNQLGEVFEDGDAAGLAAAIHRALAMPRDELAAVQTQLCAEYSWQRQESTIRDVYASLVEPPTPQGIADLSFPSLLVDEPPADDIEEELQIPADMLVAERQ